MLHDFLLSNYDELVRRCRTKVASRPAPPSTANEHYGISLFLEQLVQVLRANA